MKRKKGVGIWIAAAGSLFLFLSQWQNLKKLEPVRKILDLINEFAVRLQSLMARDGNGNMHAAENQDGKEAQYRELLELMTEAKRVKSCQVYSKFFYDIAPQIQYLLGLAGVWGRDDLSPAEKWATPEVLKNTMKNNILYRVEAAVQKYNIRIVDGRVVIPVSEQLQDAQADIKMSFEEFSEKWTGAQIATFIRQYKADVAEGQIWLRHKALVEDLGVVLEQMFDYDKEGEYDRTKVADMAVQLTEILEKHGVWTMYYHDSRLFAQPKLRNGFVRVSENQLQYPGLFVRDGVEYRQLGIFSGTYCEGGKADE